MKKKAISRVVFALVMIAAFCSITSSAFAMSANDIMGSVEIVSPRYATVRKFYVDLTISSSSQASCRTEISLYGSYTGEITMYLQDESSGWQTVKSWSGSGSICSGNYYVPKGDTYRVKGVLHVYDNAGRLVETTTKYSNEVFF